MIAKSDFISRFAFLAKIQNLTYLVEARSKAKLEVELRS